MGSQNHVGEALEAIVDQINSSTFTDGIIDVSDTLNRYHYLAEGKSVADARCVAKREGDRWLKQSASKLSRLNMPVVVRRWDEWLFHSSYNHTRQQFQRIYDTQPRLRSAIDQDIENFYTRRFGSTYVTEEQRAMSTAYYLEELAVQTLMLREKPSTVLYPGKQLECLKVIRSGEILGAPTALANSPYARLVVHSFRQLPVVNQNQTPISLN